MTKHYKMLRLTLLSVLIASTIAQGTSNSTELPVSTKAIDDATISRMEAAVSSNTGATETEPAATENSITEQQVLQGETNNQILDGQLLDAVKEKIKEKAVDKAEEAIENLENAIEVNEKQIEAEENMKEKLENFVEANSESNVIIDDNLTPQPEPEPELEPNSSENGSAKEEESDSNEAIVPPVPVVDPEHAMATINNYACKDDGNCIEVADATTNENSNLWLEILIGVIAVVVLIVVCMFCCYFIKKTHTPGESYDTTQDPRPSDSVSIKIDPISQPVGHSNDPSGARIVPEEYDQNQNPNTSTSESDELIPLSQKDKDIQKSLKRLEKVGLFTLEEEGMGAHVTHGTIPRDHNRPPTSFKRPKVGEEDMNHSSETSLNTLVPPDPNFGI